MVSSRQNHGLCLLRTAAMRAVMKIRMVTCRLVLPLVWGVWVSANLSPISAAMGDNGESVPTAPASAAPSPRLTESERGTQLRSDGNPLDPKVVRYAQRILEQLGSDDPRGLPLELWPDGQEAAAAWDADRDEFLSARELARAIHAYSRNRTLRVLAIPTPPAPNGEPAASSRANDGEMEAPLVRDGSVAGELPEGADLHDPHDRNDQSDAERDETAGRSEANRSSSGALRRGGSRSKDEAIFQVAPSRLAAGAPSWFLELDKDGDGQLTLSEFAAEPTGQAISEFRRLDWNNDGVITLEEARRGPQPAEAPSSGRGGRR
jgi:hypothetical protein